MFAKVGYSWTSLSRTRLFQTPLWNSRNNQDLIELPAGLPGRFPFDQKFRKFGVNSEWKGNFPESHFGILGVPRELVPIFWKIGITGKFWSIRPFLLGPVSLRPNLSAWLPQCSKPWRAKTCFVGEIIACADPLPSGPANKQLASFFHRSKMTLEFVWKIRCYRTFKVLANLI